MATHAPAPAHAGGHGSGHHHEHDDRPLSYWWTRVFFGTLTGVGLAFALVLVIRAIFGLDPLWQPEVYVSMAGIFGGVGFLAGIGCFDYWVRWSRGRRMEEDHSQHGATSWRDYFKVNTDHKVIGIQYLVFTFFMFILGGVAAMLVRTELAQPGQQIVNGETYNGLFSLHATLMIFVFAVPVFGGIANYVLPLMIGAKDMAFPRLNALSFWFLPAAGGLFLASIFFGLFSSGWTAYPPLASQGGTGQTLFELGVQFAGASSIATAINFLVTIITMRAPGMTPWRMPLLVWANAVTSVLVVFATPFVAGSQFLTQFDRVMGTNFFVPEQGGDVIMYQHIFWFYSHPAVYIMLLPGFGIISEVIATFSRKPIFGYRAIAFSTVAIAVLGFGVWAHHMFVSGMASWLRVPMMITTIIIAVPTGVKIWSWLATLWQGKIHLKTPMLWALGFLFTFLLGGLSGVFLGVVPTDIQTSDTYFIVAHIHYVLFGGTVFTVFAGLYYWFPKITGRMYNERLGQVHFWITFVATQLTFFPMHWQGLQGMPRRVADYDPRFADTNLVASIGSYLVGFATLIFIYNVWTSWRHGPRAPWNPWRGRTLEWQVSSPPPLFNFDATPQVVGGPYQYGVPEARHAVVFAPEELGGELREDTRFPVMVVANETLAAPGLVEEVRARAAEGMWRFEVVVPTDGGDAHAAQRRLATALALYQEAGAEVNGRVVEADAVDAAAEAATAVHPHEIILTTYPLAESRWLRRDVVDRVRKRTGVAVTHLLARPADVREAIAGSALPHLMVVAADGIGADGLQAAVRARADEAPARFTLVMPLDLPQPRWSEEAGELRRAGIERLSGAVGRLQSAGVAAVGQAIDDDAATGLPAVIAAERPDQILVLSTGTEPGDLPGAVRGAAGGVAVDHVVLDAEAPTAPAGS